MFMSSNQDNCKSPSLSIVPNGVKAKESGSVMQKDTPKRKKTFNGFSESDIQTTKNVQRLYFKKFTSEGRSQEDAASSVNWSQSTLNLYLNGKQRIGDTALRRFCRLLKVEPHELSSEYTKSNEDSSDEQKKELADMKEILSELIDAVSGKKDIEMIVMRAKKLVNS